MLRSCRLTNAERAGHKHSAWRRPPKTRCSERSSASVFGGERSLPSSEPQRLGQTPHSGTQFPQRLLMRLAPRETVPAGFPAQTPEFVGSGRASAPSSRCCRLPPRWPARKPSLRCGRAQIIAVDPPGRSLVSRGAASTSCHAACGPPPCESKSVRCSASEDFRGGFALADLEGAASRALTPAQLARALAGREKGITPFALACAALLTIFHVVWP